MNDFSQLDTEQIRNRIVREEFNIFSRLPAIYAASRVQGVRFLQIAGGLSIVEWRTLWDLHEAGPATIRDLARIQRADHSLLSRALPEMKRKGFVTMKKSKEDGRQVLVELAPKGLAAYEQAAPFMAQRRAALREVFSQDELEVFVGYLDRLEDFLRTPADEILAKGPVE